MVAADRLIQLFAGSTCSTPWTERTESWVKHSASLHVRLKCALASPRSAHHWLARTARKTRAEDWWRFAQSLHWIGWRHCLPGPQRGWSWTEPEASERGLVSGEQCCHADSSDKWLISFPAGSPCSLEEHWSHLNQGVCLEKNVGQTRMRINNPHLRSTQTYTTGSSLTEEHPW